MSTYRTVIVDDELPAIERIERLVSRHPLLERNGSFQSAELALRELKRYKTDLLFLDINMPGTSGMALLETLGQHAPKAVIFVTAYNRFAVQAFERRASDYILKPFSDERFFDAVTHTIRTRLDSSIASYEGSHIEPRAYPGPVPTVRGRIPVQLAGKRYFVDVMSILCIDAAGNYCKLRTASETHLVRTSVRKLALQLPRNAFVRCHRSTILNVLEVDEVTTLRGGDYEVVLSNGSRRRISRSYRKQTLKRIGFAT